MIMSSKITYLTDIDLNQNYLRKARFENLAEAPQNPVESQVYYNTTDKLYYYWKSNETTGEWVSFVNTKDLISQLALKQDVLTAGDGIIIEVNQQGQTVISTETTTVYQKNFIASDFTNDLLTILKSEHGCGNNPIVTQIMESNNGIYRRVLVGLEIDTTNGTVIIQANGGFNGFITLTTPYQNVVAVEPLVNNILYGSVSG